MQISRHKFFAYVEGGLDRTFYDRMFRQEAFKLADEYEIRAARELPGDTGGKTALIAHFRALKRRNALSGEQFGKPYTTAFLFDKDIDDLCRKKIRSDHAIYTETYDLEGHLFSCGDVYAALADAAQLTYSQAERVLGGAGDFFSSVVNSWSDWIALCITSHVLRINVGCTFDSPSRINPADDAVNEALRDKYLKAISQKCGQPHAKIRAKFLRYRLLVKRSVSEGKPFRYFRGKWMKPVFQSLLASKIVVPDATLHALADRTVMALVSQVGVREHCLCCSDLHSSIAPLVSRLN